ncbi:unnamed protein product [Rhizophagus irregularis]|nr:unnamed protein product [Rhizophagus irregularis]
MYANTKVYNCKPFFNPGSSDKGFQANNSLISIPDYNEFSQSPMSSLFSYGDTLLNEDLEALYLMDSILQQQPQEFHPEFQYGNNDPTWVYPTRP